jgi:hypothetical protein
VYATHDAQGNSRVFVHLKCRRVPCFLIRSFPVLAHKRGRAIAQSVGRWLPIAAARVRARVWSCLICGGQSGSGVGFLRYLRYPLPIFISQIRVAPQSPSSSTLGWYNRPVVVAVTSGPSLTPLIIIIIIMIFHMKYEIKMFA